MSVSLNELRSLYFNFFSSQDRGHAILPSSSLIPENDATTLFTGSGMQPLVPYLLGESHPKGKRLCNAQKCFRSEDIEEVGDNRHTTFFEMLGNWSLGDYFKKEQLEWIFTFLTSEIKLDPRRIYVSVFRGEKALDFKADEEAVTIWQDLFKKTNLEAKVIDQVEKNGLQDGRIFYYPAKKNWWSRAGVPQNMPLGEPGGPSSEIFFDFGDKWHFHENSEYKDLPCHPNCNCGRFLEIGNSVFMQYRKTTTGFEPLSKKNIDFGGGLERILAACYQQPDIFKTPAFNKIINQIEAMSLEKYDENVVTTAAMRVIADHLRASVFLIKDTVLPSGKERGYFLRRLIRRAFLKAKSLNKTTIDFKSHFSKIITEIIKTYQDTSYFDQEKDPIWIAKIINDEIQKFNLSLDKGLKIINSYQEIDGKKAFDLYQSQGFPLELTIELAQSKKIKLVGGYDNLLKTFQEARKAHADQSRQLSAGVFKGGLQDHSEITTAYHSCTHLLHQALRQVLGPHVRQKGSNITDERLRFDFSHPQALTQEEKQAVEQLINNWIQENYQISVKKINKEAALKSGALAFFAERYPDEVTVYSIGDSKKLISQEICQGPHISSTGKIGQVKIIKEKAVSAGIRRIYLEKI